MIRGFHKVIYIIVFSPSDRTNIYSTKMDLLDFITGLELSQDRQGQDAYIMYHGTSLGNAIKILRDGFVPSTSGMLGPGIYVTRSFQKAAAYPKHLPPGDEQVILQLRVQVGRVKRIDHQRHPLQKKWHQAGYDTAWVPPNCGMVASGLEENCVWDPSRIEVLDVLNSDGISKNLSSFGLIPDPFGYPCPLVSPMLVYPCPAPAIGVPYAGPMPPSFWFP